MLALWSVRMGVVRGSKLGQGIMAFLPEAPSSLISSFLLTDKELGLTILDFYLNTEQISDTYMAYIIFMTFMTALNIPLTLGLLTVPNSYSSQISKVSV